MSHRFIRSYDSFSIKSFKYPRRFGIKILAASFLLLLLTSVAANSRELKVRRNVRDFQVQATINRYPLVIGDNHIEIEIRDGSSKSILDAKVLINYYMPPMPRMVPMNYKTEAHLKSNTYEAKMNIIMAGPWYIKIIIKHKGKISTAKFNVDAQ